MEKIARLCLTGPESTGKTELAQRLAGALQTVWVPEYAREYAIAVRRELTFDDVEPIARGQMAGEDLVMPRSSGRLILDTDLISTVVYSRHYYGRCPKWIEEEARSRRADLYLLLDIDVPWKPDPARDAGHQRDDLFLKFRRAIEEFEARFEIVGGSWEERFQRALRAWK